MTTDDQPKKVAKSRSMPESNNESRAMLGSRTEVTSTSAGERPTTPKNTKKTA